MTSLIVVMNQRAVALATDSVATLQSRDAYGTLNDSEPEKTFSSAEKLFSLGGRHQIGIMMDGDSSFMDIPWETVFKIYRGQLLKDRLGTTNLYRSDIVKFLGKLAKGIPAEVQRSHFEFVVSSYFGLMKDYAVREDDEGDGQTVDAKDLAKIIRVRYRRWTEARFRPGMCEKDERTIGEMYGYVIRKARERVYAGCPLDDDQKRMLVKIAVRLFTRSPEGYSLPGMTEVVIAGFGKKALFPSYAVLMVYGVVGGKLVWDDGDAEEISHESRACISPFSSALVDVNAFLAGIHPDYRDLVEYLLEKLSSEYVDAFLEMAADQYEGDTRDLRRKLRQFARRKLRQTRRKFSTYEAVESYLPIYRVVSVLPKRELAKISEYLLSLTSIRQRYSPGTETVGGPIDVAVISKGDGFVWVKRKTCLDGDDGNCSRRESQESLFHGGSP